MFPRKLLSRQPLSLPGVMPSIMSILPNPECLLIPWHFGDEQRMITVLSCANTSIHDKSWLRWFPVPSSPYGYPTVLWSISVPEELARWYSQVLHLYISKSVEKLRGYKIPDTKLAWEWKWYLGKWLRKLKNASLNTVISGKENTSYWIWKDL